MQVAAIKQYCNLQTASLLAPSLQIGQMPLMNQTDPLLDLQQPYHEVVDATVGEVVELLLLETIR